MAAIVMAFSSLFSVLGPFLEHQGIIHEPKK
jgi:hypothetical protein